MGKYNVCSHGESRESLKGTRKVEKPPPTAQTRQCAAGEREPKSSNNWTGSFTPAGISARAKPSQYSCLWYHITDLLTKLLQSSAGAEEQT